jgi:hypothetical protein
MRHLKLRAEKMSEPKKPRAVKKTTPVEEKVQRKVGRPSTYDVNLTKVICIRLSNGESLAQITREDGMPTSATVYSWLLKYPEFLERYTRAREEQADTNADQILQIADEHPPEFTDKEGRTTLDNSYIQWQKNRIEARKWTAMKLKPKKYGEKLGIGGVEGAPPITTQDITSTKLFEMIKNIELKTRAG